LRLVERKRRLRLAPEWDSRVYALTPAKHAFLDRIGAWRGFEAGRVTPIYDMRVFGDDGRSRLDFSATSRGAATPRRQSESGRLAPCLGRPERQRNLSLLCRRCPRSCRREDRVEIRLEDGNVVTAKLARRGRAESWVRRGRGHRGPKRELRAARRRRQLCLRVGTSQLSRINGFRRDGVLAYLLCRTARLDRLVHTRRQAPELLAPRARGAFAVA